MAAPPPRVVPPKPLLGVGGEEGGVAEVPRCELALGEEGGGEEEGGDAEAEPGGPEDGEVRAEGRRGGDDDGFFAVEGVDVEVVGDGEGEVGAFLEGVGDAAVELLEGREAGEAHPDYEMFVFLSDDGGDDLGEGFVEELVVVEAAVVEDGVLALVALVVVEVAAPADVSPAADVDAGVAAEPIGAPRPEALRDVVVVKVVVVDGGPVEVVRLGEFLLPVAPPGDLRFAHRALYVVPFVPQSDDVVEHRVRHQAAGAENL
mmetsp:Transcript_8495/g.27841  ORF Transcript_8495/g.27841 Transcript_8495/m.27841 type:complete len:260 (-) Transcript_8495:464-1243(-)